MVAVKNLTTRASKYVPSNVSWDGKSETFDTFFAMVSEYVEIELGETAVQVLLGKRTMLDGLPIPKYMYATWSQRLYMVLMGRINLGKDPESATSASAKAVMNTTIDNRADIKRSAYNLLCFWRSLGQVVTEQDCVAVDFKIKAHRVESRTRRRWWATSSDSPGGCTCANPRASAGARRRLRVL